MKRKITNLRRNEIQHGLSQLRINVSDNYNPSLQDANGAKYIINTLQSRCKFAKWEDLDNIVVVNYAIFDVLIVPIGELTLKITWLYLQ
jgi:hypothetical protein